MCFLYRTLLLPVLLIYADVLLGSAYSSQSINGEAKPAELILEYEKTAVVFDLWEMQVHFTKEYGEYESLPPTQINDAYDADRNGVYVRLEAEFTNENGAKVTVPGFAMKEKPDGEWSFCVRWSPRTRGKWSVRVRFEGREKQSEKKIEIEQVLKDTIEAKAIGTIDGPLVAPGPNDNPSYIRKLSSTGTSKAIWLFGACRAWVLRSESPESRWYPNESIDREKELFAPMREGGFNLLNQWMAPWEYLIVHQDKAEYWEQPNGTFRQIPIKEETPWTSWQCYDQGRALAFDRLVRQCEGTGSKSTIYLLLSPMSHQSLQAREHPWGSQESDWNRRDDPQKQTLERFNGFSEFLPDMTPWQFFEANPAKLINDWQSQLFDHQANYFRYVIARWGYSRAIGVWVIVDEIDAVGNEVGWLSRKSGWWGHPECEAWLANIIKMFRGELTRSDGMQYAGDPFKHVLHAASTSFGGQIEKGANVEWEGGGKDTRPDLLGWHWYPRFSEDASWNDAWAYTIEGIKRFEQIHSGKQAGLISEFGVADRLSPEMLPSPLYPTLYHYSTWASVFSGLAGTAMDWDDGKEFGELRWRNRKGAFDKEHYPIDHIAELKALRSFLEGTSPEHLYSCQISEAKIRCSSKEGAQVFALYSSEKACTMMGWIFSPENDAEFEIMGLPAGTYELKWYDPWTGKTVRGIGDKKLTAVEGRALKISAEEAFSKLRAQSASFPEESRFDKGKDAAFKILRK